MTIAAAFTAVGEALAAAWTTLLQKKIALGAVEESALGSAPFLGELQGEFASATISFSGDLSGAARVFIPKLEALTMVGLMIAMGGDEAQVEKSRAAKSFGDTELDALREAFNQLAATTATVLRDRLACSVAARPGAVEGASLDGTAGEFDPKGHLLRSTLELEGYGGSHLYWMLPAALAEHIANPQKHAAAPAHAATAPAQAKAEPVSKAVIDRQLLDTPVLAEVILADRIMKYSEVLNICVGSVLEFKKLCDAPVNLEICDTTFANGEVVATQDQHFALRVHEVAPRD